MARGTNVIARDRLHPGLARVDRVFAPNRQGLVHAGVYKPANRWRQTPRSGNMVHHQPANKERNILQRPLLLAKHLPWLPKCNYARS